MAHQLAERLLILNDVGQGLLARVHNQILFEKPPVLKDDPVLEKYSKLLLKNWPEFPNTAKGIPPGYENFKSRSTEIVTSLKDYYLTYIDILNYNEETLKNLKDGADSLTGLQHDINSDLVTYYLNVFTHFIQLQILISRVEERKLFVACYAQAYLFTVGNTEKDFSAITKYLDDYEKPLLRLQTDLAPLTDRISETLIGFMKPVTEWSQVSMLIQHRVFNILEEPAAMTLPKGEQTQLTIVQVSDFKTWIMWGYLVCPYALNRPGALELLQTALKDVFVVPVFRDQVLPIHQEFRDMFENFKSNNKNFKLSAKPNKKYLKDAREDWQGTLNRHAQLRTYLRVEMDTLVSFFNQFPTLIAPKLQMVLTVVHMARDEILWYYRHGPEVVPYKLKAAKYMPILDPNLSHLIHLTVLLIEHIQRNAQAITKYYGEYLTKTDRENTKPIVEQFLQSSNLPNIMPLAKELIASIMDSIGAPDYAEKLQGVRMNWYRVSAAISHRANNLNFESTANFSRAMTVLINHSRNVDCLDTQIRSNASFKGVYWYSAELLKTLESSLEGDNGQPGHCLSMVKVLNSALDNVHRMCPEEHAVITADVLGKANTFLRTVMAKGVFPLVKKVTQGSSYLRAHTSEERIIDLIERQIPIPVPQNMEMLQVCRRALSEICNACRESDSFSVAHVEFVPREYLYEQLSQSLRSTLRSIVKIQVVKDNSREKTPLDTFSTEIMKLDYYIERPSVILSKFKDVIYSYQEIEKHININLSDIAREVLLREFYEESGGMCGESPLKAEDKEDPASEKTTISIIARWYATLFSLDLGSDDVGIAYSRTCKAFLSRQISIRGSTAAVYMDASYYTDVKELQALATLIGPYGMRVLDRALLAIVAEKARGIKDIMTTHLSTLAALESQFIERPLWIESRAKLMGAAAKGGPSDLDNLVLYATIIGCILIFRRLLRQGLADVTKHHVPFIYESIRRSFVHAHGKLAVEPELMGLDYLADDAGIGSTEINPGLFEILQRYKAQVNDKALWDLLPEAFGMAYVSTRWQRARYHIHNDGHENNSHAVVETVHQFIVTFQRVLLKTETNQDVENRIQQMMERFVRNSAYSLLHIHATGKDREDTQDAISHAMIFLEQFILASGGRLQLSFLEDCFPYTILRVNYIKLYEAQATHDKTAFADADEGNEKEEKEDKDEEPPEKKEEEIDEPKDPKGGHGAGDDTD